MNDRQWPAMTTVTHLEMVSPGELIGKPCPAPEASINLMPTPDPETNRYFYLTVGEEWGWFERRNWTLESWRRYVSRDVLSTWLLLWEGKPVGYCELEKQPENTVEIAYFGIIPEYTQKKLGGWFLSEMVRAAWSGDTKRVWVHTCDLDHPAALANYLARGFRVFKTTQEPGPPNND